MTTKGDPNDSPVELTDVEEEVYRLTVVNRLRQTVVAARLGVTQQAVSDALIRARAKLPALDYEAMRRESLKLHQDIQRRAYELAEMAGAPVYVGKDGALAYDEHGVVVRDYGGRVAALKLAADSDKEIRKLHGLDAAAKAEISGTVRYEIAGLPDTDALS